MPTTQQNIYTKVRLIGFKNKYQKNCSVNIEPIAKKIIEHCMMYFISNSCPQIILSDEDEKIDINDYYIDKSEEYNNKFSKLGFTISTKVKNVTTSLLDRFFKFLNDFLNE